MLWPKLQEMSAKTLAQRCSPQLLLSGSGDAPAAGHDISSVRHSTSAAAGVIAPVATDSELNEPREHSRIKRFNEGLFLQSAQASGVDTGKLLHRTPTLLNAAAATHQAATAHASHPLAYF